MARHIIFYPPQGAIVGPAQFATQCVANWERQIKTAYMAQVGRIQAFSKLCRPGFRQRMQKPLGIDRACLLILFKFATALVNMGARGETGALENPPSPNFIREFSDVMSKARKNLIHV